MVHALSCLRLWLIYCPCSSFSQEKPRTTTEPFTAIDFPHEKQCASGSDDSRCVLVGTAVRCMMGLCHVSIPQGCLELLSSMLYRDKVIEWFVPTG